LWEETYLFTNLPLQFPHDFHNDFPKVSYETLSRGDFLKRPKTLEAVMRKKALEVGDSKTIHDGTI